MGECVAHQMTSVLTTLRSCGFQTVKDVHSDKKQNWPGLGVRNVQTFWTKRRNGRRDEFSKRNMDI